MSMNLPHRGTPDRFISDDEILELLNHVRHNPMTHHQHANKVESTTKTRPPKCSNSNLPQYMRISRPAWNIFLKCYLCLRPKTDNPITIDFHDTWDALVILYIQIHSLLPTHRTHTHTQTHNRRHTHTHTKTIMPCATALELVTS